MALLLASATSLSLGCGTKRKDLPQEPTAMASSSAQTARAVPVASSGTSPAVPFAQPPTPSASAPKASAVAKNDAAFAAYKAGRLDEAEEAFEAATRDDPTYALAHFNLACTRGRLRKSDPCRASFDAILAPLRRALALAPEKRARFLADDDLSVIRSTVAFEILKGASLGNVEDVKRILPAVAWKGDTAPGVAAALGPLSGVAFRSDGSVVRWTRALAVEDSRLGPPQNEKGTYVVAPAGGIQVRWPGKPAEGWRLGEDGTLTGGGRAYRDTPVDCAL
jgi:tetratricopeptide (TPR) repeat protein